MSKVEQLRKCLQAKRKELNAKGYKYIPGESKLMDCKPFEIAYQDCIETLWPEEPWWKITNYWDIFDAMMGGLSDEEVIDEICNHVAPEFLKEGFESAKIEDGHSYDEYMDKFGRAYQDGELWDFSEEDFKGGAIEINPEITYWKIEVEGEPRYFETLGECKEACHKEKKSLDEGTSNFPTRFPHGFPLLVFYTIDEVYDRMSNDSDYPEESDFEDEDGNVDEDAYWEAREKFEQDYWDKIDCCILDESQVDELEDKLYDFNQETKSIAYDADVGEDGYQQYSDKLNLEDVELKIEPGYYEAAYIDVDHEDYLDGIEEGEWKEAQIKRIKDFMQSLVEEFGLSEYEVAWGPASNGETGYRKVKKQEEKLTPKNEGYTLLGKEDKEILAFSNYNNAVKKAEELGLKLAEYGDVYGSNVSYAFWNKSGNRNDDEEVMCYYFFGKDGKPRADVTRTELNQIAKAFGIPESDIDDAEEAVDDDVDENMYDGKKGGNKGSVKTKVHVNKNAGNPKRNMEIFNHMMGSDAPAVSTGVALGESAEGVARVEYCLMSDGDNVDCYDDEADAIANAKEFKDECAKRGMSNVVRVLLVKYGPKDEHGDEPELSAEEIWPDNPSFDDDDSADEKSNKELAKAAVEEGKEPELPKEVEIDAKELDFDGRDEDEVIGDYLSDKYGFCHFGFKFEKDGDKIQVSDIEWDTSESLKEAIKEGPSDIFGYINGDLKSFEPKALIEKVKERKQSLHTNRMVKDTDDLKVCHHIVCDIMGPSLEDAHVWVDVVEETWTRNPGDADDINSYSGKETQDRILMKSCGKGEEGFAKAIEVLEQYKKETLAKNESLKEEAKEQKFVIIDWSSKTLANNDSKYEELKARAKKENPNAMLLFYHPINLKAAYDLVANKPQKFIVYTDHEIRLDANGKKLAALPNLEKIIRLDKNESLKEEKEYLSDKVIQVLDDYGILYGDIVENGDGTVNIVGVDEDEWDEVVEAIKAELGLDVLVPDSDHGEFDDELIVRECLKEASSALKKAYRNGGEDYGDLIQGRAIARIKDPKARAAAVAAARAGRKDVVHQFTGDRKEGQAEVGLIKKQGQMAKAGLKEEESSLTKKIEKVISAWLKKQGYEESDLELFVIEEKPYEDGEGHKANHVQIRNDLVGFYEADELISELDKLVEPGYFEPDYDTVWDAYVWEMDDEAKKRYAEFQQWLKGE